MEKIKSDETDNLYKAILKLQTIEECSAFFDDICTINELLSLSQRYHVASLLEQGKTYTSIKEDTGASTATISRVNRALCYGSNGYKIVLERMKSQNLKNNN